MPLYALVPQRAVVCATVVLAYVIFWPGASDPINVVKLTVVVLGAIAAAVLSVARAAVMRRVAAPFPPFALAVTLFMAGVVAATATSDVPGASVVGELGRNGGLMLYLSCAVLALVVARAFGLVDVRWVAICLVGSGGFAATYGLLQQVGLDAVNWVDLGISPIIGTLGNPNFASAYAGIVLPLAAWGALTTSWDIRWRSGAAAVVLASFLVTVLSDAAQGVLAGLAGLAVVGLVWLAGRGGVLATRGIPVALGAGVVAAGAVAAGLAGTGPLAGLQTSTSLATRRWYWSAAIDMWRSEPVTGVGLDRYGAWYRSFQPQAAGEVDSYSDAAHSVPLQFLATGGALLAATYLVVALVVAFVLVRGLWKLAGEERLLLAGVGGAWVAYQVQSVVSIDHVTLAVTHWVLAGAVVALAARPTREFLLPGAVVPPSANAGKRTPRPVTLEVRGPATVAVIGATCLAALGAGLQALEPLRASHASRSGAVALLEGDGNRALEKMTKATSLAPYEDAYWLQRGRLLEQVMQDDLARQNYANALRHDPRAFDVLKQAVAVAMRARDGAASQRLTEQLRAVDPRAEVPVG